jgi:hypothetical protein
MLKADIRRLGYQDLEIRRLGKKLGNITYTQSPNLPVSKS